MRPSGREKEKDEGNEYYNRLAYQLKTQQLILKALLTKWNSDTDDDDKHEYESKSDSKKVPQEAQDSSETKKDINS